MQLHPEAAALVARLREAGVKRFSEMTPEQAREGMLARQRNLPGEPPAVASVTELELPGPAGALPALWYRPTGEPSPATIVYFHGGGWVVGGLEEFDRVARAVSIATGCDVVSVDYRLAPEHPFPAAVEDADAAVRAVAESHGGSGPLIVMGDSAGATLATLTAIHARDRGGPRIALQVLVYPVADHTLDAPSFTEHADAFPLGTRDMEWCWDFYAPSPPVDRDSPDVSPLRTPDLRGLPPALIVVAGHDPTRDHSIAYAQRLEAAGVPTELLLYDDVMHGFFSMVGVVGRADEAMNAVGERVRAAV